MAAVGVEGDERERLLRGPVGDPLTEVLDDDGAAGEPRGQGHDQRADHSLLPFRVLVLLEELIWPVDQKAVKLSAESLPGSQTEIGSERVEHGPERAIPAAAVDLDPASRDLPRVAHPPIEQGLLAMPIASRARLSEEALRLIAQDWELERSYARDGKNEIVGRAGPRGGK